jgi:hypothetical protein
LSSNLDLMQTSATAISTRVTIQNAFQRYYAAGNNTLENWVNAQRDIEAAISLDASLVLQARLWGRSADGIGSAGGLLNGSHRRGSRWKYTLTHAQLPRRACTMLMYHYRDTSIRMAAPYRLALTTQTYVSSISTLDLTCD